MVVVLRLHVQVVTSQPSEGKFLSEKIHMTCSCSEIWAKLVTFVKALGQFPTGVSGSYGAELTSQCKAQSPPSSIKVEQPLSCGIPGTTGLTPIGSVINVRGKEFRVNNQRMEFEFPAGFNLPTNCTEVQNQDWANKVLDILLAQIFDDGLPVCQHDYEEMDGALQQIIDKCSGSYAHFCAGIDAPTCAMREFVTEVKLRLSVDTLWSGPDCSCLVEYNHENQKELQVLHPKCPSTGRHPCCLFGDIHQFLSDQVKEYLWLFQQRPEITWGSLLDLAKQGLATTRKTCVGCCLNHPMEQCDIPYFDALFAGTPCTDFSNQDNSRPREKGKTMLTLATFGSISSDLQPTIICYENVVGVNPYVNQVLVDRYFCDLERDAALICPAMLGHPLHRER